MVFFEARIPKNGKDGIKFNNEVYNVMQFFCVLTTMVRM
jgi:hypothetical protein